LEDINLLSIVLTVVATLFVVTIIRNLSTLERQLEHRIEPDFAVGDPQFERVMSTLMGPAILQGNHVKIYRNGNTFFPVMLQEIQSARESITFETFIYWSGQIGRQFTDALIERADSGVRVHLIVDWLGGWKMERDLIDRLANSRVEFQRFRPPGWHNLAVFNNRTHRKILVIDGRIAFTGGAGIADAWNGNAEDRHHWRDTQYMLTGPSVAQMQAAFMDNWVQVSLEVLLRERYFPELPMVGNMRAHCFMSGPGSGSDSARLMYLVSLACARKSVRLGQGYFVPDRLCLVTLVGARRRGVRVQIIVQGPTDARAVNWCSRALWGKLLKAGVEIYKYERAMYHCKTMIVDECWVSVGSTNFDTRSFRLNDEINLSVLDENFAREEAAHFDEDLQHCRQVSLQEWQNRSRRQKILDRLASLLRTQM
jgi:cardiolipin synthase